MASERDKKSEFDIVETTVDTGSEMRARSERRDRRGARRARGAAQERRHHERALGARDQHQPRAGRGLGAAQLPRAARRPRPPRISPPWPRRSRLRLAVGPRAQRAPRLVSAAPPWLPRAAISGARYSAAELPPTATRVVPPRPARAARARGLRHARRRGARWPRRSAPWSSAARRRSAIAAAYGMALAARAAQAEAPRRSSPRCARAGASSRRAPDRGEPRVGRRSHALAEAARHARLAGAPSALAARRGSRDHPRDDVAACRAMGALGAPLLRRRRHGPHALQRRRARDRRLRHRARRHPRRDRGRQEHPRPRRRDAARTSRARASPRGSSRGRHPRRGDHRRRWPPTSWRRGEIDAVVVGADRIARNGDVANKIGTYGARCLARARTASRSTSPRRGARSTSHAPTATPSRSRSASRDEVALASAASSLVARRRRRAQPGLRRDPGARSSRRSSPSAARSLPTPSPAPEARTTSALASGGREPLSMLACVLLSSCSHPSQRWPSGVDRDLNPALGRVRHPQAGRRPPRHRRGRRSSPCPAAACALNSGSQGGQHIWLGLSCKNLGPRVTAFFKITDVETGLELTRHGLAQAIDLEYDGNGSDLAVRPLRLPRARRDYGLPGERRQRRRTARAPSSPRDLSGRKIKIEADVTDDCKKPAIHAEVLTVISSG